MGLRSEFRAFALATQMLYCLSYTSSHFAVVILEMEGSHKLSPQASLEL
jgi:hypothetical protein